MSTMTTRPWFAVLALAGLLFTGGCAKDACEEAFGPSAQLTLELAPGLELAQAALLQLELAGVVNGARIPLPVQPDPIAVTEGALRQESPSVRITFSSSGGIGGSSSLPEGAQLEMTVILQRADKSEIGRGSVTFAPRFNACNFYTVRIEPTSGGGADSGVGADAGPGSDASAGSDALVDGGAQ